MSERIKSIQAALARHGFNPGGVDGVWGRRSIAAVKAFQTASGLVADGVVGPITAARLFGAGAGAAAANGGGAPALVWRDEARRLIGTREVSGPGSNRQIMTWADDLDLNYDGDDVAWCGLFVSHCIAATLPEEVLPSSPLGARAWLKFGERSDPVTGAVLVFWRGKRDGWQGHVGFYEGEDNDHFFVLGGNQSDAVNVAKLKKDRLLQARWPSTARLLTGVKRQMAFGGDVSTNEA